MDIWIVHPQWQEAGEPLEECTFHSSLEEATILCDGLNETRENARSYTYIITYRRIY